MSKILAALETIYFRLYSALPGFGSFICCLVLALPLLLLDLFLLLLFLYLCWGGMAALWDALGAHTSALIHMDVRVVDAGSIMALQGHMFFAGLDFLTTLAFMFHHVRLSRISDWSQSKNSNKERLRDTGTKSRI